MPNSHLKFIKFIMNRNAYESLRELQIDDYIWYIYIFIVFAALLSNSIERDYIYTHSEEERTSYQIINIALLTLAFFIYLYFLKLSAYHYEQKRDFANCMSLLASIFLLLSGALAIIAELKSSSGNTIDIGL